MRTLVQQRSAEIGIRMALGAPRAALLRKMLGQALGLTMAGVTLGLVLSLALAHFLRPMLFGISVLDPGTWSAAVASILAIAAIASFVPVRRAIRADPLQALRGD
jgi:putative ABC transport system permease protein